MHSVIPFALLTAAVLCSRASYGQSPWTLTMKSGISYAAFDDGSTTSPHVDPAFGLGAMYSVAEDKFGFGVDAFYEPRFSGAFEVQPAQQFTNITVPFYIRTGAPEARAHVSVGAFWSKTLNPPTMGPVGPFGWKFVDQEWGGNVGLDVRVYDTGSMEMTVGASARIGLTSAFEASLPPNEKAVGQSRWYGFTLNTYFHPRKKKK